MGLLWRASRSIVWFVLWLFRNDPTPVPAEFSARVHIRRRWRKYLGLVLALTIWCNVDVARRADRHGTARCT